MMPAVLFLEAAAPIIGRRMGAAPYGSWESPISAARAAGGVVGLSEPWLGSDGSAWWLERRPLDEGRTTLVRDGNDVTPPDFNVRTGVHEYGGGSWVPHGDTAFCSRWDDQRLYRLEPGAEPRPISPAPPQPSSVRYADGRVTPDGQTILCVRETHGEGEPVNEIVALSTDGQGDHRVLASGRDFYACPRPSPDGAMLAYTCWDHPNMPWDGCELWVAALEKPEGVRLVAGGPGESIWQPDWSPAGELHFVSDRNGFWNLYTENAQLTEERAELGHPQWLFGGSTYAFLADGSIGCIRTEDAVERLCVLRPGAHAPEDLGLELTAFGFPCLRARGDRLIFAAGSAEIDSAVQVWSAAEGARVVKRSTDDPLDPAWASRPRGIQVPSGRLLEPRHHRRARHRRPARGHRRAGSSTSTPARSSSATADPAAAPAALAARARRPPAARHRLARSRGQAGLRPDAAGDARPRPDQPQRRHRHVRRRRAHRPDDCAERDRQGVPRLHAAAGHVLGRGRDRALPVARPARRPRRPQRLPRHGHAPGCARSPSCSCRPQPPRSCSPSRSSGSSTSAARSRPTRRRSSRGASPPSRSGSPSTA